MSTQKVKEINIKSLILWTENPRDPVDVKKTDQYIADRAINKDGRSKWSINKLFLTMGKRYDFSELPTVSYVNRKPVVFDGNRRIIIGKIIHGYVQIDNTQNFSNFEFPELIPCNVCTKKIALEHVLRKHGDSGSWGPLERDIFLHKHMQENKSPFLIIDETMSLISKFPSLNQRFVRDEMLTETNLHKLGFSTQDGVLKTRHNPKDAKKILYKIINLVEEKNITTRKNRGRVVEIMEGDRNINKILKKDTHKFTPFGMLLPYEEEQEKIRKTRITKNEGHFLFGNETLILSPGTVNNLYSDCLKLYDFSQKNNTLSNDFPRIIRMSLRLICDFASKGCNITLDEYIRNNFDQAKAKLSQDEKKTLYAQSVKRNNIVGLLHIGAHGGISANNIEQTVAISLVIGKILQITHGK